MFNSNNNNNNNHQHHIPNENDTINTHVSIQEQQQESISIPISRISQRTINSNNKAQVKLTNLFNTIKRKLLIHKRRYWIYSIALMMMVYYCLWNFNLVSSFKPNYSISNLFIKSFKTPLTYRNQIESITTSRFILNRSNTLSFDHIYVLSLPNNFKRRQRIQKIGNALELNFTFIDAIEKNSSVIDWIGSKVKEIRNKKRKILSTQFGKHQSEIGGMKVGSDWLLRNEEEVIIKESEEKIKIKLPALSKDWVKELHQHQDDLQSLYQPKFNIQSQLYDPLESKAPRQLSSGTISVWYGQTKVMRKMLENQDRSALVLEDDVDLEWDLGQLWSSVLRRLPKDHKNRQEGWEIVYLGHCWGRENSHPQYGHPNLHRSSEPRCLHAYALSHTGVQKILKYLSDPWIAYQTAIDIALPTLIKSGFLKNAFSIEPAWIIQDKTEFESDVQPLGKGSLWAGYLMDSTWDRVLKYERNGNGKEEEEEWVERKGKLDPATVYREPLLEESTGEMN
ncbi:uncharacterized protein MELLADRAFT_103329 [Melampsora larici-populina 98AG31]|uniref:Family 25 glycosyltransferase n=1 Tax=Melampsora larici-populina (strain 98AG31 / pathotype 3-4-7) TaxID=747676 RepID=F4RA21_MELLP|nr:uncharacterized protein MELLADRAFT_103329 [Melampsora larici-populina 98AG31]EGG10632.1 hypothetical protein MELLADRAFT_103329 [Melampsora larici-populina 98AG31]